MRRETDPVKFMGKLRDCAEATHDVVMPLASLRMNDDARSVRIARTDGEPMLLPSGVADYVDAGLMRTAHRQLAETLGIPLKFLDDLSTRHPDLAATNVNTLATRDWADKARLFRFWRADDGVALRSLLSDRYGAADNYAAMQSIVAGLTAADVNIGDCETDVDISPDRFRMRIAVPQVNILVPELLNGYRSPFDVNGPGTHAPAGDGPQNLPVLWAGLEFANSETGGGAYTITPRAVVLVCRNGMTRTSDAVRQIHIGKKLEEGLINWSDETRRLNAELLSNMTADAVRSFCSTDYLTRLTDEMRAARGLQVQQPTVAMEKVVERFTLSEKEHNDVLNAFMRGGDTSVLGIGQAITAAAQLADDSDRQSELEARFWEVIGAPHQFVGAS